MRLEGHPVSTGIHVRKFFKFDELGTNYRTEIIGGITTFLAMAYIHRHLHRVGCRNRGRR